MVFRRRLTGFVAAVALVIAAVPGAGFALTSYDGSDYSFDFQNITRMAACDQESDDNGAYAKYKVVGSGSTLRLDDPNGSAGGCGYSGTFTRIYSHQTCEDVQFWPDSCGGTVYP